MYNAKSLKNLQTFDTMGTERHRELSRKGGKASAKAKRKRKEQIEMYNALLKYGDFFKTFMEICDKSPKELERMAKSIR